MAKDLSRIFGVWQGIGATFVLGTRQGSLPEHKSGKDPFFALIVHFKVRTGPQKGSSGEENTQSTLHMAIGPYRILYVLPALLGVCVV